MFEEAVSSSMSPLPIRRSAPGWSRMHPAVGQRRDREGHAARDVGLDHTRDDVDRWTLGGDDQVDADGTGHLGDAHDGVLDVAGRHHHEVVELVDHDEDERQRLRRLGLVVEFGLVLDRRMVLAERPGRDVAAAPAVRRRGGAISPSSTSWL